MKLKGITLLLCIVAVFGDEGGWSWGSEPEGSSASPSAASQSSSNRARSLDASSFVPITQGVNPSDHSSSTSGDSSSSASFSAGAKSIPEDGDTAPRFLGLGDKLCSIGIGINCKKPHLSRPNGIPGNIHAARPIPGNIHGSRPVPSNIHGARPIPGHIHPAQSIAGNIHGSRPVPSNIHPAQSIAGNIHAVRPIPGSLPPSRNFPVQPNPFPAPIPPQQPLRPHSHVPARPVHQHEDDEVVVHHHTHTHIHHAPGGHQAGPIDPSFQPASQVPGPIIRPDFPAYREECTCVHASFCPSYDVVARNNPDDIRHLLDARNRLGDIKSNATEEGDVPDTEDDFKADIGSQSSSRKAKVLGVVDAAEGVNRTRRDTLEGGHHHHHNETNDAQGRTLSYTPGASGCGAAYVCCRNPHLQPVRQRTVCGQRRSTGIVGRVKNPHYIKGDTEFGEYPWHVAILNTHGGYVCGGALIDDRHVLTAAHCINNVNPTELIVRLGDWDVSGPHEFYKHLELPVSFLVVHPEYYAGNLHNDIAVVRMHSHVNFAEFPHIAPVCLPEKNNYFVGQRCYSTGWGKDAFGNQGQFQTVLKEVELPIVEHYTCESALRQTRLGYQFSLHQGNLCAGGEEGKDTCQGDGGGPLVCEGPNGSAQLAGLVSWGIGCGEFGVPGVYVNVGHYVHWIHTVTSAP